VKEKLATQGVEVAVFTVISKQFPDGSLVSKACSLPILTDTSAVNAWLQMSATTKDYLYVYDKQVKLVAFLPPWEKNLNDPAIAAKLEGLLTTLAK
jgi:hypothetical protein